MHSTPSCTKAVTPALHLPSVAGSLLASGSDDLHISLWDLQSNRPIVGHSTGHTANIFCVKFMPTTGAQTH